MPGRYRLLLLFLLYMPVLADDALVMPLAPQSLLLDVQYNGGRLVAVGERGHILLSDDLVDHWRQARSPTRQMLTAVHFPGPQRGWAVGHDGLILGSIAEQGFVQAWTIGAATEDLLGMFFGRPITLGIIAFILLSLFYPLIRHRVTGRKKGISNAD